MPIYEFNCTSCGKTTEKICASRQADIPCPECGNSAERIVSVFSGQTSSGANSGAACLPGSGFT